jgi:mannose-6-phosphate isomerase-like protein (cupin superfamily)
VEKINLKDKLTKFSEIWAPRVIAEMNAIQFKLVKLMGEFIWHKHDETDEVFFVLEGSMVIEFRDHVVDLSAGEMIVVRKDVEHKPVAREICHVMLVEPCGVTNTGDAGGPLTSANDVWV